MNNPSALSKLFWPTPRLPSPVLMEGPTRLPLVAVLVGAVDRCHLYIVRNEARVRVPKSVAGRETRRHPWRAEVEPALPREERVGL